MLQVRPVTLQTAHPRDSVAKPVLAGDGGLVGHVGRDLSGLQADEESAEVLGPGRPRHQRPELRRLQSRVSVEPYLITLTDESEVFPLFQHAGIEFIFLLEGEVLYRHGRKTYTLKPGDSLFFDAEAAHGPEELIKLPIRMIAVLSKPRPEE